MAWSPEQMPSACRSTSRPTRRYAGAGSCQEEQKSPIAPTGVCRPIWSGDDDLDLGVAEMTRHFDVSPLDRDCQEALGDTEGGGICAAT